MIKAIKIVMLVLTVVLTGGCSSESTNNGSGGSGGLGGTGSGGADSGGQGYGVGDTAQLADYKMTLVQVGTCTASDSYFDPKPGNIYIGASITLQATADIPLQPFMVTDKAMNSYALRAPEFDGLIGCKPPLGNQNGNLKATGNGWILPGGQTVSGWVTFEVPATATGLTLHFDPFVTGTGAESVSFDWGI